jgi:hypothetical protein
MRRSRRLLFFALLLMATLVGLALDDCETWGNSLLGGGSGGSSSTAPPCCFEFWGGAYSFKEDCFDPVDPITMVVRRGGANVVEHVSHHGAEPLNVDVREPQYPGGEDGRQYYEDSFVCVQGQVSQGTNDGWRLCGVTPFNYPAQKRAGTYAATL